MSNQQQEHPVDDTEGLPSALAVHYSILFRQGIRIVEHMPGDLKTDSMFNAIADSLRSVPLKRNQPDISITPKM
jgi:hypothetical protein